MRAISIKKVMNGYIVTAGCQTLVFGDSETLLKELGRYLEKPREVEKEYLEKYGMSDEVPVDPCIPSQAPPGYPSESSTAEPTSRRPFI